LSERKGQKNTLCHPNAGRVLQEEEHEKDEVNRRTHLVDEKRIYGCRSYESIRADFGRSYEWHL
jgi:hypothetical protein